MELVNEWIPAARFVQIVRDGRDVALSHQTMPYGAGNIADCARAWASRVSMNAKMGRILGPERYCALRFEDLVSDSEKTLARLCRFLGVAFDPAMLRYTAMVAEKIPEDRRWLWPAIDQPPQSAKVALWRRAMTRMSYLEAGKQALAEAMEADARVWALGEDLGRGGVFGQYRGLAERFGPERIVDAPISEAAIMGAAVGAALCGTRPVVEMRFSDFALCAVDELVNQAAKARFMFGGQGRVPLVAREPIGMWRSSAAQHSQSLEAWYAHIPGLVVVAPSTPADNRALLRAAIACDDPVVYMEHKDLWALEGEVPEVPEAEPLGRAALRRRGDAATLVSWSKQVHVCLEAAEALAATGIEVEVIDLRTLWPWDQGMVLDSVRRTGRLLVVQEAVTVAGFGAEVAASVAERLWDRLKAPVRRLGSPRAPISYAPPLEDRLRVAPAQVAAAVETLVAGGGS
ncbi:MAG: sulfotransferase [Proteobacteria bacterium]|nr:sulfotransferase [Pseudomonadota bacterium]